MINETHDLHIPHIPNHKRTTNIQLDWAYDATACMRATTKAQAQVPLTKSLGGSAEV